MEQSINELAKVGSNNLDYGPLSPVNNMNGVDLLFHRLKLVSDFCKLLGSMNRDESTHQVCPTCFALT